MQQTALKNKAFKNKSVTRIPVIPLLNVIYDTCTQIMGSLLSQLTVTLSQLTVTLSQLTVTLSQLTVTLSQLTVILSQLTVTLSQLTVILF